MTNEKLLKNFLEPKVTETKSIKVEELQTEMSEDGFVMPEASYEDVMSNDGDKK